MTNEEAIKRIAEHMTIHKMNEPRAIKITTALKMAICSLEKQIPKKPTIKPYFDAVCCPICMETIDSISIENHRDKYCHYCGTKIDWGENK